MQLVDHFDGHTGRGGGALGRRQTSRRCCTLHCASSPGENSSGGKCFSHVYGWARKGCWTYLEGGLQCVFSSVGCLQPVFGRMHFLPTGDVFAIRRRCIIETTFIRETP
jgi:hypothetical protein